jgi:hypothetical protein
MVLCQCSETFSYSLTSSTVAGISPLSMLKIYLRINGSAAVGSREVELKVELIVFPMMRLLVVDATAATLAIDSITRSVGPLQVAVNPSRTFDRSDTFLKWSSITFHVPFISTGVD